MPAESTRCLLLLSTPPTPTPCISFYFQSTHYWQPSKSRPLLEPSTWQSVQCGLHLSLPWPTRLLVIRSSLNRVSQTAVWWSNTRFVTQHVNRPPGALFWNRSLWNWLVMETVADSQGKGRSFTFTFMSGQLPQHQTAKVSRGWSALWTSCRIASERKMLNLLKKPGKKEQLEKWNFLSGVYSEQLREWRLDTAEVFDPKFIRVWQSVQHWLPIRWLLFFINSKLTINQQLLVLINNMGVSVTSPHCRIIT